MPEIRQTTAYLTINNRHLDRNFRFKIIRSSHSLQKTASVYIKRNYFLANRIEINTGDKIFISLQNNKEDKVLIFSGITKSVSTTSHEIHLEACFKCVDDSIFEETYKDTNLEKVLKILVEDRMSEVQNLTGGQKFSPKLKYQAEDRDREQIIVQGAVALSLHRLLTDKYYFLDLEDDLVVRDKPKQGANFIVDDCLYFAKADCIAIFPIPQCEINDTVEYQGNQYIIESIVHHYLSRAQMILGVKKHEEELQKMDTTPKAVALAEVPTSKPVPPLFISVHYKKLEDGSRVFVPLEEMIPQINGKVWDYLTELAEDIRSEMGDDFESIAISSGYRSKEYQRDTVFLKKIKLQGASSMYGYYEERAPASAPYLKIIQYLYDGVYSHKIDSVSRDQYLADLEKIGNTEKRRIFQEIIEEYIVDSYEKDDKEDYAITRLLTKSYVNPPKFLFNPSYHVIGDENNKASQAIDLRTSKESELLKEKHNNKRDDILKESKGKIDIGRAYDGGADGEPHIHVTYKPL